MRQQRGENCGAIGIGSVQAGTVLAKPVFGGIAQEGALAVGKVRRISTLDILDGLEKITDPGESEWHYYVWVMGI